MDSETLTLLLKQGHLNMRERIDRGVWPHPPLIYADVLDQLVRLIENAQWFPEPWKPVVPGQPVREGGIIERVSLIKYVYRSRRSNPAHPYLEAEQVEKVFSSAKLAADYYLKWDLHLPGDLDGWEVIL
jgi:hypothetical protein